MPPRTRPVHPAATPPPAIAGGGLLDYGLVVWRHRWLIGLLTGAALALALAVYFVQPKTYLAIATVQVQPTSPLRLSGDEARRGAAADESFFATQLQLIRSRRVAGEVVARLSGEDRLALASQPSVWSRLQGLMGGGIAEAAASGADPAVSERRLIYKVRQHLSVFRSKDSEMLDIRYEASSPSLAAQVANTYAQAFADIQAQQRLSMSDQVRGWMSEQSARLKNELTAAEQAVSDYRREHGLLDTRQQEALAGNRLSQTSTSLMEASRERIRAEVLYREAKQAAAQGKISRLPASVVDSSMIPELKLEQAKLEAELDSLRTHYGEAAPKVVAARAELDATNARLSGEIERALHTLEAQYQEASRREQKLIEAEESLSADIRDRGDEERTLAALERDAQTSRALYEAFQERIKELKWMSSFGAPAIRVLDEALPPGSPYSPNLIRMLGIAGLLSLFGSVGLAFLMENLRRTVRTPVAVERSLHTPGLGILPRLKHAEAAGMSRVSVLDPGAPFSEALAAIRARLQMAGERPPQVMVVSSALQGEGKSTLSSNLAASFGQLSRTLLIDADLRRASISSGWKGAGLTEFVAGQHKLSDCVQRDTVTPNLFVMGKGQAPVDPLTFFAQPEFAQALGRLRQCFDKIIIDSAPVLSVSDVETFGAMTDGVVMTVKCGKTPMDAVVEACRRLHQARVGLLGVALTQAPPRELNLYGGYGYGLV